MPSVEGFVRFCAFLVAVFGISVLPLMYVISEIPVNLTDPQAAGQGYTMWVFSPVLWIFLSLAIFFAGYLDFPKFRFWIHFSRAVIASFFVVFSRPIFGAIATSHLDLALSDAINYVHPWFRYDGFDVAFLFGSHVIPAWIVCSLSWFMPNGPKLLPFGFLYRYVLIFPIIVFCCFQVWVIYYHISMG